MVLHARRLATFCLLGALSASAQPIVAGVVEATSLTEAQVRRVQRATEAALRQTSSLPVGEGPAFKKGAPKRCADTAECAQHLADSAPAIVLLELRGEPKSERVTIDCALWLDGTKVAHRALESTLDSLDLRPTVEALLPGWARKGFGGLVVEVEAVLKVDGRVLSSRPSEVVPLPAGVHQVDLLVSSGHAVLQRLDLPEGARLKVNASPPQAVLTASGPRAMTALRGVSYGVFVAGAATLSGGLIAGALGRGTGQDLASCQGDSRGCATLDVVQERQAQAQAYASTGNVMLGVGVGLAVVGVGLFLIDVLAN